MAKIKAKANKAVIIDAIVKQIEKGKGFGTVLKLIGTKWNLSRTTYSRYWKSANEQHTVAQQILKEAKAALDLQNALNERQSQIADVMERKEILTKIARGQIPLRKAMVVDGTIEYIDIIPDWMDRKAAIAELNKMEGDYAPTKVAQTDSKGNDVAKSDLPQLSSEQILNLIDKRSNA
jgi:hypothetical protein